MKPVHLGNVHIPVAGCLSKCYENALPIGFCVEAKLHDHLSAIIININ